MRLLDFDLEGKMAAIVTDEIRTLIAEYEAAKEWDNCEFKQTSMDKLKREMVKWFALVGGK